MDPAEYGDYAPQVDYYVHRVCTPSWEIEESITGFIDLTYVTNGSALYFIGEKIFKVSAGDLLCIPKGSLRSASSVPEDLMECFSINFTLHNHLGEEKSLPFPIICRVGHQPDIIALYRDMNAEWLRRAPGCQMKVRAIALMILQRYFELIVFKTNSGLIDNRIKKSIRYITDNYARPITIQDLAQITGLNSVYLGNLFKLSTGMTFRQYLTSIRLNHAEDMLRSGEYNVNEAALMCGFSDIFYFSKVFKENRGISPSKVVKSV